MANEENNRAQESMLLVEGGDQGSYLTRCVAIVTILHERGVLDELLQSGRIALEEVDRRVAMLEQRFPGFRELGQVKNQDV